VKKLSCHCGKVEAEINTFELKDITVNDGHSHPLDQKKN